MLPHFGKRFTYTDWLEVVVLTQSRTFGLLTRGEKISTLAPFGEYFNHRNPHHVLWHWDEDETGRKGWFASAVMEAKIGEQVYTSYGLKDNIELFSGYGFIEIQNEYRMKVKLRPLLNRDDPLLE